MKNGTYMYVFDLKSVISEVCFLLKLSNLKHTNWVYGKHGIQNPESRNGNRNGTGTGKSKTGDILSV